ncbi:MAG: DUF2244 domain-containing protein [Pseudomonadota bacterium]
MTADFASSRAGLALETMAPNEVGRVSYDRPPAPGEAPEGVFEALLQPNRSLPPAGFGLVMAVVIGVNLTLGLYFSSIGAWPVIGFCGLDIFLVWLAFKVSYRQGRLHERVRVTADEMLISRVLPSGHESRWRLQPYWTDVTVVGAGSHEAQVRVRSRGRTLILGAFLAPKERVAFGEALRAAIAEATSDRK